MEKLTCKPCGAEVTCERFPFGYACVCSNVDCARHRVDRFHLTEEAAQRFFVERKQRNGS